MSGKGKEGRETTKPNVYDLRLAKEEVKIIIIRKKKKRLGKK